MNLVIYRGHRSCLLIFPKNHVLGFITIKKVDSDHASDTVARRSRTGFLVSMNLSLIYWSSRKKISVESSSFGSKNIALKQCCE